MKSDMVGGWVNQAYSRLSTTHGHITDCKLDSVVYAGVCVVILMWTCLVWPERSTPDNFRVSSHRFNAATGEQKWITQTIYTEPEPPSRMPNSLMPSAKLRSANLPFLRLWYDAVGDRTPASRTPSGRSNHYATRGRCYLLCRLSLNWPMSVAKYTVTSDLVGMGSLHSGVWIQSVAMYSK